MIQPTYTPLWSEIVHSSVWKEPDHVRIVWITMLAVKGRDHIVRLSAYALADVAKKTEAEVLDALKVLSSPDTKRIEPQPWEGRRIERVEDGWLILNGAQYQKRMAGLNRLAKQAQWMRDKRARENEVMRQVRAAKGPPLKGEVQGVNADNAGDRLGAEKFAEPVVL